MFQAFTHCLLFNNEKNISDIGPVPSSDERVGRHFPSTVYCVLLNTRRGAEFRNPVQVPRSETFSTELRVRLERCSCPNQADILTLLGKRVVV